MRYRGSLTIPAGTAETDPATSTIEVAAGTITEVEILFPAGHAGLTYLAIWYQERQIFPTTPGQAFRGDDHVIEMPERRVIREVPLRLELRGWSPDATLDHTVYVDVTVEEMAASVTATLPVTVALPEGFV
jgi:hypothetical protein